MGIPIAAVSQVTMADEPTVQAERRPDRQAARTDVPAASRSSRREELSLPRPRPVVLATQKAALTSTRWTTAPLNVWSRPGEGSRRLTVLDSAVKVPFTGTIRGPWAEIEHADRTGWVRKAYLVRRKPSPARQFTGVSGSSCPDGSSVESGLQPNTVKLYRAVCAAFPAVSSWGGRSGYGGDHGAGLALDIMSSGALGAAIADYVRAHASDFGVSEVIFAQRIWSPLRGSEGWRAMEDRGSSTANHYDHVHVSVS